NLVTRMHQPVGQLSVRRQEQKPRRVEIEAADVDPAAPGRRRQALEDRRAILGILPGRDLARRLVIGDMGVRRGAPLEADRAPVDDDALGTLDAVSEPSATAVDRHPALGDPGLDLPSRAEAGLRQHFLNSLGQNLLYAAAAVSSLPRGRGPRRRLGSSIHPTLTTVT